MKFFLTSKLHMRTVFLGILFPLMYVGCDKPLPSQIWVQEKQINISVDDFEQCTSQSLTSIPEISINTKLSRPYEIVLNVDLENWSEPVTGSIKKNKENKMHITFFGKGYPEPEEVKLLLTPIIEKIAKAIEQNCSHKNDR